MSNHKRPTALYTPAEGWERYIDDIVKKKNRPAHKITEGLPLIFKEMGIKNKDIIFDYKHWLKYHTIDDQLIHEEITSEVLKTLPEQLANPIAIFDSVSKNKRQETQALTVFTHISVGNDRIMMAVHLDVTQKRFFRKGRSKTFKVHKVASVYKKDETIKSMFIWKKYSRYIDEERVNELLVATKGNHTELEGVQFPQLEQLTSSHNHKVILKSELVKKYPEAFGICPEENLTPQVEKSPIPKHNQVQKAPIPNIDFSKKEKSKTLSIKP